VRSGLVAGTLFGLLAMNEALTYHSNFATPDERAAAVAAGNNGALTAVIGPARELDTLGGWVSWRVLGLLLIIASVWGLLTATRLMRREEEAGRWELLLAGRTDRRDATAQALGGLALGLVAMWSVIALLMAVAGGRPYVHLSVSACLLYAATIASGAAIFLAVGALTSQLATTRRQANMLGAGVFAVFYLIRMIADSGSSLAWMRWLSPLGWSENLRPLTGSQPWALVPITAFVIAASVAAVVLAGRRDVGVGTLVGHRAPRTNTSLLDGPFGLTVRLERWVALAWVLGLGVLALIFGVTAATVGSTTGASSVEEAVGRLGVQASGVTAWIGYEFIYLAALVMYAAATHVSALRGEESDGHLDNLLGRRTDRRVWLAGRAVWGAIVVVGIGLATGVGAWIGLAAAGGHVGLRPMIEAGLNITAPSLLVLGLGVLLYGVAPRLAAPALYAFVLWTFLVEIVGTNVATNHWVLDTAVLTHIGPVPAASFNLRIAATLLGIAVIAASAGCVAFAHRDLRPE
jgi:ABC-2 type transport system permease protein